jgi:hypothetical protein
VFFSSKRLSVDMCSLLYSYLGFVLSVLSDIGGCYMEASVLVVIGSNMVGTKKTREAKNNKNYTQAELKDSQFGCNSRTTTKGHLRMSFFFVRNKRFCLTCPLCHTLSHQLCVMPSPSRIRSTAPPKGRAK